MCNIRAPVRVAIFDGDDALAMPEKSARRVCREMGLVGLLRMTMQTDEELLRVQRFLRRNLFQEEME
jgi:hypothetical protein